MIWTRSSAKLERDAEIWRAGVAAIDKLNQRLASPKTSLKDDVAIETAARTALESTSCARWVGFELHEREDVRLRQESRGRTGADTRYRRITRVHHHLRFFVHEDIVTADATSDGCWPLVTNDTNMSDAELLVAHKRQSHLELKHQLKSDQFVAPMFLHDPARIKRLMAHLVRRRHGGRQARVRGTLRVGADFSLLSAAVNLARLAKLDVRSMDGGGWTVAP